MREQWRIWRAALLWLMLLAPFFFLTYGQVNQFTQTRVDVGSIVFGWEHNIPFLPWTIIPYWSLDLLYGLALFVCTSYRELHRLGIRLVLASLLACLGFLLFPLRFSFTRPSVTGPMGWLFQQLEQFDLPYNQSPSLHIILCWLLWCHYRHHVTERLQWLNSGVFLLIAVSVLTTWQHHVIDVVSGLGVGLFISWLVPEHDMWQWHVPDKRRRQLAWRYAMGMMVCTAAACYLPVLWWGVIAMGIIAISYAGLGVTGFQKNAQGQLSLATRYLLLPWRWGAWATVRYYMRHLPAESLVHDGVSLGYYPRQPVKAAAVLDLTCEFSKAAVVEQAQSTYLAVPMLDLTLPDQRELSAAVTALAQLHQQYQTVLVHCALGLTRSAVVIAAWLLAHQHAASAEEAMEEVRQARPHVLFPPQSSCYLTLWHQRYQNE